MKNIVSKHMYVILISVFSFVSLVVIAEENNNKEPLVLHEYKEIEIEYRKSPGSIDENGKEIFFWKIKDSPNLVVIYPESSLLGKTPITNNLDKTKSYKIRALAFHFAYGIYHVLAKGIEEVE